MFDDTGRQEVWNDGGETRVVLLVRCGRPLRAPGKWLADAFLEWVRRSSFVREARRNIEQWDHALHRIDSPHR